MPYYPQTDGMQASEWLWRPAPYKETVAKCLALCVHGYQQGYWDLCQVKKDGNCETSS
jgi:hypothetical protein